jgi:hypothetical protein
LALTDTLSITDAQFGKLLAAIDALKPTGRVHWETVIPVFLGAFLGICTSVLIEYFKNYLEKRKINSNKREAELGEINVSIVALAYNLEVLTHLTLQGILPHYEDAQKRTNPRNRFHKMIPDAWKNLFNLWSIS